MRARTLRNAFRAAIPTALVLLLLSPAFASPIARRGLDESCENIKMVASTAGKAPGQRPGYVPVCADLPPGSERALPERQTGEPFRFVFNCTVSDTLCARAELGFESAGARIAKALNITSTVIVSATFRSFCGSQGSGSTSTCELKNTLGYATPSSIIQVGFSEQPR